MLLQLCYEGKKKAKNRQTPTLTVLHCTGGNECFRLTLESMSLQFPTNYQLKQ